MFIDTHAHLNFKDFEHDINDVLKRARDVGVEKIINVGATWQSSQDAVELASKHPKLYATVGLHPTDIEDDKFDSDKFIELANNPKVVAVGETGLDYYQNEVPHDFQKELFKKQIEVARELNKPLIIHGRDSYDDILNILSAFSFQLSSVLHCFVGDWEIAKRALELGLHISFTGIITFNKTEKIQEVVKKMPLERMMIETDCPWLAPVPYRGKRNEPSYVVEVAKKVAEIRGISLEEVEKITTQNAINFFKLGL